MPSAWAEPWTSRTPVNVSLPTEVLPDAVPAVRSTVTPPVAEWKTMRVSPFPVIVSLPPTPSNSLKVEARPVSVLAPVKPVAT